MDPTNRIKHLFPMETTAMVEAVPLSSLQEKQAILAHYIRLVARKLSNGVACVGVGGLGKSWVIAKTLAEEGISPVLLNSHVTPLSLYRALYFNRSDAIIWMDDIDSCLSNLIVLGILRSCLWGQGQRIVTYTSSQLPDDLPPRFVFDSRLIICANVIARRNEALKATLTRIDTYTLDATNEEVLEQMRLWANRGNGGLSPEQCHEVVSFIEQAGGTRRLSLRLYEPSLRKYEYAGETGIDWRELVRHQLDQLGGGNVPKPVDSKTHDLDCLKEAIRQFPASVKDQEKFWTKATGKSRASFFRLKRSFDKEGK
jgi:hypothetical protein